MTYQLPDTLTYKGIKWAIDKWHPQDYEDDVSLVGLGNERGIEMELDIDELDPLDHELDIWSFWPSNETLGIQTQSPSTNNIDGRIDHFLIHLGELFLFKVEVNPPDFKLSAARKIRREVVIRYEPMDTNILGTKWTICERKFEYLIFEDLRIGFTGDIFLSEYRDEWEIPGAPDLLNAPYGTATASFKNGLLTHWC